MTADDFRDFVLGIYGVSALVGDRMYIMSGPQNVTKPYIIYAMVDRSDHDVSGVSGRGIATFTVDVWDESYDDARAVALLIQAGLDGYLGVMGECEDVGAIITQTVDTIQVSQDGGEVGLKGQRLTVDCWYNDTHAALSAPTVTSTSAAFDSGTTGAASGKVTNLGAATRLTEIGVCWGTSSNPTIAGSHTVIADSVEPDKLPFLFGADACMTSLVPGTTYHARLYATNSEGTGYGADLSFTYPFAVPLSFTYNPEEISLIGTFSKALATSSTIPEAGWSGVAYTGWELPAAPKYSLCFIGELGSASGTTLTWSTGVLEESSGDVNVTHATPTDDFVDEWGVRVPAFVCTEVSYRLPA